MKKGYGYEAEEGEGGDEEFLNYWKILSGRKYCPILASGQYWKKE